MNRKHVEVVAAVIKFQDLYLLVQRPFKGEVGGKWEFPGGKIESGESHVDALKREINEELSLELTAMDYLTTHKHAYVGFDLTIHFYLCPVFHQKIELREHIDYQWLQGKQISAIDLADADRPVLPLL